MLLRSRVQAYGLWEFRFVIPDTFPYDGPKVTLLDPIWHPNIDEAGAVCVSLLRDKWKPTYQIEHVVHGLLILFSNPNPLDPLNQGTHAIERVY